MNDKDWEIYSLRGWKSILHYHKGLFVRTMRSSKYPNKLICLLCQSPVPEAITIQVNLLGEGLLELTREYVSFITHEIDSFTIVGWYSLYDKNLEIQQEDYRQKITDLLTSHGYKIRPSNSPPLPTEFI